MATRLEKQVASTLALFFGAGGGTAGKMALDFRDEVKADRARQTALEETVAKLSQDVHDLMHARDQEVAAGEATSRYCRTGQLSDPVLCSGVEGWEAPAPRSSPVTVLLNDPNADRIRAARDAREAARSSPER